MANGTDVWVLGGYQSDFARNFSREGLDFADLFGELVRETLGDAKVAAQDIGVVHVGNAFGQLFTGQGSSVRCRRRWSRPCGACLRLGTKQPAPQEASPCWPR